jgi:hypothetical protein
MVRLTAPLSRNSVGLVRPTHGSCGLLKKEQTAGLNEWPPDRRDNHTNASPLSQSLLRQSISVVTPTATLERQRYQVQTTPPGQSQKHITPCESDDNHRSMTKKPTETQAAEPPDTFTILQTLECNYPHTRSETNRYLNKPPPAPMSQNKRRRSPINSPLEATINSIEKATPPPRDCCIHQPTKPMAQFLT